ncbi:MAG TPA: DUF2145 domain-containing protein [Piscinibacter sp.]|nr:DUF2145 domain-containing protein [Piscinibacter sp.]
MKAALAITLATALASAAGAAQAGRSCEQKAPEAVNVQRAMTLAQHTAAALDASGAQVVVLARAGQDLSKYGLAWSHLGLAYKDGARWRVVHKLNACGTAEGALFRQGLGEFFLDDLFEPVAAYAVPTLAVQAHLLALLGDNGRVAQLHHAPYSMVAYPWAQRYQQSNQWAIETLAMAQSPEAGGSFTRERAQAWLKFSGYEPTTLRLNAFTRLGARATAANVAFDDHPNEKRFSDRIETVTVDSVFAWLNRSGLGGPVQVIR